MSSKRSTVLPKNNLTVFLIGVHINKPLKVTKWLPVLLAMPPMLKELSLNKGLGCMSFETLFKYKGVHIIQYWESNEQLLTYSKMPKHLKAWKTFSKRLKNNDAVGFYHETYNVNANAYENIYLNMPQFGLSRALVSEPITKYSNSAKLRLNTK